MMAGKRISVENVPANQRLGLRHEIAVCAISPAALLWRWPWRFGDRRRVARTSAGVGPKPRQPRRGLAAEQADGVAEVGVKKIVMADEGGDRGIAIHCGAEIVEREAIARQGAQEPQGCRSLEQPSRSLGRQPHLCGEDARILGACPEELEDLKLHASPKDLGIDEACAQIEQRPGSALR
jgi:hypothetical protein